MKTTHRWYPLLREWERTLSAENKAPKAIQVYDDRVRQLIMWLDQFPVEASDARETANTRSENPNEATRSEPRRLLEASPRANLGPRPAQRVRR